MFLIICANIEIKEEKVTQGKSGADTENHGERKSGP
jgi:hypothetical protein